MQELPEGPLTDQNGKQWNLKKIASDDILYEVTPHIERKPLFTDPCGNACYKGDSIHYYDSINNSCGMIHNITVEPCQGPDSPAFLHKSDCEKWVASNVKTMTREDALEWLGDLWEKWDDIGHNTDGTFTDYIESIRKETCLPTSTQK